MTRAASELAQRGLAHALGTKALDVAMGAMYNLQEGMEVDVHQLEALEAEVESALALLDAA